MDSNSESSTAERLHRERRVREVLEAGEWLTREQLDATQCPVDAWRRQGQVFGIEYAGRQYYARYQFDAAFQPRPVIEQVITTLGQLDEWHIAAWFYYPNAWLVVRDDKGGRNVAPKDHLDRGSEVIAAAAKRSGTYVA